MATYKHSSGKRFLFIHIPRTGGRFIEVNLEQNGWEVEPIEQYGVSLTQHSFIDDCEIAHFHRDLYEKHCDIEGIPQIAVIRNPITKFISTSTYLLTVYGKEVCLLKDKISADIFNIKMNDLIGKVQQRMEDYDGFVSAIEEFPHSETLSWWKPQVDFISDKTHIWKFERGLGAEFGYWLREKLDVPFEIDLYANYPANAYEEFKLKKTPKLIENIKKFYREDVEKFYNA
tara:strand:- start:1137 stop:1826 length:690 start_codon:yes stop_codon:yes gene_type:complete